MLEKKQTKKKKKKKKQKKKKTKKTKKKTQKNNNNKKTLINICSGFVMWTVSDMTCQSPDKTCQSLVRLIKMAS